jgi:hypothetical protein
VEEQRAPSAVAHPTADHGKTCLIALGAAVLLSLGTAGILAVGGVPTTTTSATFFAAASLAGFAFCAGQGAAVTGFLAMKQKQNPLYVLPAILGALLGCAAFLAIFGFSIYLGAQQAHHPYR